MMSIMNPVLACSMAMGKGGAGRGEGRPEVGWDADEDAGANAHGADGGTDAVNERKRAGWD